MKDFKVALKMLLALTLLTGVIYPAFITAYSMLVIKDKPLENGSELLGQKFTQTKYFWGRPSANDYNPSSSGASNQGPTSEILKKQVDERAQALKAIHPENQGDIPQDLLFASGSGLDPHISPDAAYYQAPRVAKARSLNLSIVQSMISQMTEKRQFGILGEPRVNVLKLNLALDRITP